MSVRNRTKTQCPECGRFYPTKWFKGNKSHSEFLRKIGPNHAIWCSGSLYGLNDKGCGMFKFIQVVPGVYLVKKYSNGTYLNSLCEYNQETQNFEINHQLIANNQT